MSSGLYVNHPGSGGRRDLFFSFIFMYDYIFFFIFLVSNSNFFLCIMSVPERKRVSLISITTRGSKGRTSRYWSKNKHFCRDIFLHFLN